MTLLLNIASLITLATLSLPNFLHALRVVDQNPKSFQEGNQSQTNSDDSPQYVYPPSNSGPHKTRRSEELFPDDNGTRTSYVRNAYATLNVYDFEVLERGKNNDSVDELATFCNDNETESFLVRGCRVFQRNGVWIECVNATTLTSLSLLHLHSCSSQVEHVSVHGSPLLTTIAADDLASFTSLQTLSVTSSGVSIVEDGALSWSPSLTSLNLSRNALVRMSWRAFDGARYFNKSGVRLHALPGVSFNISDRLTRLKLDVEHNPLSQACQNLWLETLKASNSAADSKASGASLRPHDASCAPPQIELSANYSAALEAVVVQCTSPGQPLLEVSWSVAPSSLQLDQYSAGQILVTKSRQAPLCSFQNITCRARNDFAVVTKTISWTSLCRSNKDQKAAIHSMTQSSYKIIMNFSSPHPEFCSCWSFRRCSRTSERPCSKAKVYHITGSNFLQNDGYLYCKQMYHGWFKFAVRSESEEVSKVLQIGDLSACKSPSDFEVINTIHVLKIKSASSVTESPQWDVDHHTQQDEEASEEPEAHTPLLEVVLPLVMVVLLLALLPCVSWVLRQPRTQRWRTCQRRVPACKTAAGKVSYFLNSRLPGSRVVFSRDEASSGEGSAGRLLTLGVMSPTVSVLHSNLVENPEYQQPTSAPVIIIPNESLKFEHALGEGAFGTVYYGTMEIPDSDEPLPVALKTLHAGGEYISQEVEREAATLSSLTHPNIVAFHGLCYDSSPMVMVFEYMEHGDLNNFLREHNREAGVAEELKPPLSVMDDLQIALQVAAGMTYLASQHYVHRDLAARNCLVGANMIVKIGDFGMSRDIYMSDYYTFGCQTMLPIRWMPPESILYRRFTVDSDVWSFGVLLWEVFTGGQQPWYGYSNQEVITKITACLMLPCPEKCPDDLYAIMKKCWSKNPSERPSMAAIHQSILSLTKLDNCIHIGSLE